MENILAGLNLKICCVFIDDVIIFGKTYEEQLHNLAPNASPEASG
jgi:orotate phosphoribosyltransferase-like protein